MENLEIIALARKATRLSYSPYSKFRVGAIILTKNGNIFEGANIENSSYSCCMCAERNAIYNAYMHGFRKEDLSILCIVADTKEPVSPCGACRQVISELFPTTGKIILGTLNSDSFIETNINNLLPNSFNGDVLL